MAIKTKARVPAWWRETKERVRRGKPLPRRLLFSAARTTESECAELGQAWEAEQRELVRLLLAYERACKAASAPRSAAVFRAAAVELALWRRRERAGGPPAA